MNHTKAVCGHPTIAVGAPGSPARAACESAPCDECAARALDWTLWGRHPKYADRRPIKLTSGSYAECKRELDYRTKGGFTGLAIRRHGEPYQGD